MWKEIIIENLPILRKMLRITQRKLASTVGVTISTIINIENRKAKPYTSALLALISYFSSRPKTASYLLTLGLYKDVFIIKFGFNEKTIRMLINGNF